LAAIGALTLQTVARARTGRGARAIAAVLMAGGYPIAFALLYRGSIESLLEFAIIPVGLAAWVFGTLPAIIVEALELAAVALIFQVDAGTSLPLEAEIPTILLVLIVAVSIGHLRNARNTLTGAAREADALARATRVLVTGGAEQETLQGILTAAIGVVPSRGAAFITADPAGERLHIAATAGHLIGFDGESYASSRGITGRAWRSGAHQVVADVTRDPDYLGDKGIPSAALAVPLVREGRPRGILYFERDRQRPYTPSDVRIMEGLADHVWIALEREERQHALGAATDRFAAAFQAAPSGLVISTVGEDKIVEANEAFLTLIGRSRAEVVGRTTLGLGLIEPETAAAFGARFAREGRLRGVAVATDWLEGGTRHFLVSAEVATIGGAAHVVTSMTEVTEAKRAALDNERLALFDVLTGLPNRNLFTRRVKDALEAAAPTGRPVAVLFLDLDHFKDVNDTFGHPAGDRLLGAVGERIRAAVPATATTARLGGDEFGIMLDAAAPNALPIAEEIRRALQTPFDLEGHAISVSASIGISFFPEHGDTETALLQRADISLYAAKATGGGTVIYAAAFDAHSPARLALTADLQRAIGAEELVVHYQPIVALRAGGRTGVEALARWPHPVRGPIAPSEFIPAAERSGLIKPLTEWVVGRAIAGAQHWRIGPDAVDIAINVSMRNLLDQTLPETVARHIAHYGVRPERISLEITESVAMAEPERTLRVLLRLHDLGVHLAIDDFGTGHSSLAYLRRLPVQTLKIDRSFVAGLTRDEASRSIVKATVELGHALGLEVTAEGVEDDEQLRAVRELGCDHAQGFLIARPMSAADMPSWFASHPAVPHETVASTGPHVVGPDS
jgi:diguanylate cyclase (GGDEF)-like protein/PAS domain S-box-containing protein